MQKRNVILVISGPAGSGKNTVAERLMSEFPAIKRVVTTTSRPPRGAEKDGEDYYFLSPVEFERAVERGEFYEYAKVHDRYYGTSKKAVIERLDAGDDIILIIDVQGANAWRKIAAESPEIGEKLSTVFIAPETVQELRARLKNRATETESDIERRMLTAETEFAQRHFFDYAILSKTKDEDFESLKRIYLDLKSK